MEPDHAPPNALWASLRHGAALSARGLGAYGLLMKGPPAPAPSCDIMRPLPADADRGRALLAGSFGFGGENHRIDADPWNPDGAGRAWRLALHDFGWLDDVRAVDGVPARRRARALVDGWITWQEHKRTAPSGALEWRGDVVARRLWSWAAHYEFLTSEDDTAFTDRLRAALGVQFRHLTYFAGREDLGEGRLTSLIGLAIGTLAFDSWGEWREPVAGLLTREIANADLADGSHASRSPAVQFRAFADLVALREVYRAAQEPPPDAVQTAIDRMAPATRFNRHGDGGLSHFNGTGSGRASEIDTVLSLSEARGRPPRRLPHGGFERISAGKLLVLADVGSAPPERYDGHMHAAPLSFEASWGPDRMIVNCGVALKREGPWTSAQRATAAHSALTLSDTNATEITDAGLTGKRRATTSATRNETEEAVWLEMEHDGYGSKFGTTHRRRLYVDLAGNDLRGEDTLIGPGGQAFSIRFHLHPKIQVSLLSNHASALLRTPGGTGWRLRAAGADMTLADSIYLAGQNQAADEVKRTQQIILTGVTGTDGATVKWALQRETKR